MTLADLEKRLLALEQTVEKLQKQVDKNDPDVPWWLKNAGMFANDPVFDEIVRLGREYRESLRPGSKNRTKKAKKKPAHDRA
jgi:hypothetical protein